MTENLGQADAIEITPAMIDAGIQELKSRQFSDGFDELVRSIYLMMEIERRFHVSDCAEFIKSER